MNFNKWTREQENLIWRPDRGQKECSILTFDPGQNAIQGHASEGSDTF